jgi:hypothetical protein
MPTGPVLGVEDHIDSRDAVAAEVLLRQPITADAVLSKPFNYAELASWRIVG